MLNLTKRKERYVYWTYEGVMVFLALVSIGIACLDLMGTIDMTTRSWFIIDNVIFLIFWGDYLYFLVRAEDKQIYFKKNIITLIAIMPLARFLKVFRIVRVSRFAQLTQFTRVFAFLGVYRRKVDKLLKTNGFIYMIYTFVALIIISSSVMSVLEGITFLDALWWCIVTITTVGYGDIVPVSGAGRVLATLLIIYGVIFIAMFTSAVTTYFTRKRELPSTDEDEHLIALVRTLNSEQKEEVKKFIRKLD